MAYLHRRRMKTEAKAKVVASVWRTEFIQFLAALSVLLWTIWIKGWITPWWYKRKGWIHPNLQERPRQNCYRGKRSDDLSLFVCLYPSSMETMVRAKVRIRQQYRTFGFELLQAFYSGQSFCNFCVRSIHFFKTQLLYVSFISFKTILDAVHLHFLLHIIC